jgi:superoxide reductase
MSQLKENTSDGAKEKHVPVFEGNAIKVGSVAHPMLPEHHIEWIELVGENKICRRFLSPGEVPKAVFEACAGENVYAREYCNLHGLWKGEK